MDTNGLLSRLDELASAQGVYADLFHHAPDAWVVTDAYSVIRQANAAAARLLGRRGSFLAGKPLIGLLSLEHRREARMRLLDPAPHQRWTSSISAARALVAVSIRLRRVPGEGLSWVLRRQ